MIREVKEDITNILPKQTIIIHISERDNDIVLLFLDRILVQFSFNDKKLFTS